MSWFSSPLVATAAVCGGLALLAIPLRQLTSGKRATAESVSLDTEVSEERKKNTIPCMLQIKTLSATNSIRLSRLDGALLWEAKDLASGEQELSLDLEFSKESTELLVEADFKQRAEEEETALFLTVYPDGMEEKTRYAIGSGQLEEVFLYQWKLD